MSISKKWMKAGNIPEELACSSIIGYGQEILCATAYNNNIYKFDMDEVKYKWEEWIKTPSGWGNRHHQLAINKSKQKIYKYGNNEMNIFDVALREWKQFKLENDVIEHKLFMLNNSVHCIGGDEFALHRIWDENAGKFNQFHKFEKYKYIRDAASVYNPTTQTIVLIGGMTDYTPKKFVDFIWQCSVKDGKPLKWTKTNTKFAIVGAQVVVAGADIVIAGGRDPTGKDSDEIYILNTETFALRKSAIRCPKAAPLHLMKTGTETHDESLICGYVRALYKTDDFQDMQLASLSVIKMIGAFHSNVMLHWISKERRFGWFSDTDEDGSSGRYEHYMIPLKDVFTTK